MEVKKILFLLFLIPMAPVPAFSDDLDGLAKNLQKTYQESQTWQAEFIQSTFVDLLNKKIQKEGNIFVKKPGKIRIEYQGSTKKLYLSNGEKLWIYSAQDSQVQTYKRLSKLVSSEALSFLHGFGHLSKEFSIYPYTNRIDGVYFLNSGLGFLVLIPKNPNSVIEKLILGVDKRYRVQEMNLVNRSGNKTHYIFKNIQLNTKLSDAFFEFIKPKGVREIRG